MWEKIKAKIFVLISFVLSLTCFSLSAIGHTIPPGFELVTANPILKLYINRKNSQLIIQDLRNTKIWRSSPVIGEELRVGGLWKTHLESPFILYYTDEKMQKVKQTNPIKENAVMSFQSIERGLKVNYQFVGLKIGFSLKFEIEKDYLKINIPEEDIREDGKFRIVSLGILPFLGTPSENDRGYIFVPDGCGAIRYFKRPTQRTSLLTSIYGPDSNIFSFGFREEENMRMPVFGLVKNENAFLTVITKGDFNTNINYSPSGYIVNLDRIYAEFVFRNRTAVPMKRGFWVHKVASEFLKGEREIRYFFLKGKEANYVGMAKRYREYLLQEKGFQKLKTNEIPPLDLRIFCAAREKGIIFDRLIKVTSFDEVKPILEILREKGVREINLTLIGWQKGGYDSFYPNRLPVEAKLGGERGLKDLVEYANNHRIYLYLEDDYLSAFSYAEGFYPSRDAIRGLNKLIMVDDREEEKRFLLNPYLAYKKFAQRDIPKISEYGVNGLEFSQIGNVVLSDRNRKYPLQRGESASYYLQILNLAKNNFDKILVQGGNMYTLKYVDKIIAAPLEGSNYLLLDEDVPFYQIVLHGIIPYTGPVANLRYSPRTQFLKQVEYGALSLFELTYEKSVLLRRTNYNKLFSSYYMDWIDEIVKEYQEINENMGYLQTQFIQHHHKLVHGVYQTTYEDGTKVIVNYNEEEYTDKDINVKGLDYLVIKKEQNQ